MHQYSDPATRNVGHFRRYSEKRDSERSQFRRKDPSVWDFLLSVSQRTCSTNKQTIRNYKARLNKVKHESKSSRSLLVSYQPKSRLYLIGHTGKTEK